jgi:hypothetical protein
VALDSVPVTAFKGTNFAWVMTNTSIPCIKMLCSKFSLANLIIGFGSERRCQDSKLRIRCEKY